MPPEPDAALHRTLRLTRALLGADLAAAFRWVDERTVRVVAASQEGLAGEQWPLARESVQAAGGFLLEAAAGQLQLPGSLRNRLPGEPRMVLASALPSAPTDTGTGWGLLVLWSGADAGPDEERLARSAAEIQDALADALESAAADAAERRQAEEAHRQSERWGRTLFEHAADGIGMLDASGRLLDVNQRVCHDLGYTRDELLGLSVTDVAVDVPPSRFQTLWEQVEAGTRLAADCLLRRKDDTPVPMEIRGTRMEVEGRPVLLALLRDVSEQRQLEEQLRQAQKMEAVGRLAGGVAHDFNNHLTAILGFASLLELELPPDAEVREYVHEIQKAAKRSSTLTHQLLAFSRKQVLQPQLLELNTVVSSAHKLLHRVLDKSIELTVEAGTGIGRVMADPGQLEQVLANLLINAQDAMPGGGRIVMETLAQRLSQPLVHAHGTIPPGDYAVLAVHDSGPGMEAAVQERVFEPFFTTKEQGKGTGLGLAMVHGVVRQSGGHITVQSNPGAGSTFRIYLPIAQHDGVAAAPPRRAAAPDRGTVLLVDDEASVRNLAQLLLQREGYQVLTAENGEEALRTWREQHERIDLVLTDVMMPRMGGYELGRRLREEGSAVPIVYMSGYTADQRALEAGSPPVLHKPFSHQALLVAVEAALHSEADRPE